MSDLISKNVTSAAVGSKVEYETGSVQATQMTRRAFIRTLTVSAAALVAAGCGGGGGSSASSAGQSIPSNQSAASDQSTGGNHLPVWDTIPTITFTEGVAASFSIAAYVTDADNDALMIAKNAVALPAGVTYDLATKSFVYDGVGGVGITDGHVLTASEG